MVLMCPRCSQENYEQAVLCSRCGFRFLPDEDATPLKNAVPAPMSDTASRAIYRGNVAQVNSPQLGVPQFLGSSQPPPPVGSTLYTPQSTLAEGSALYALQPGGSAYQQRVPSFSSQTGDDPFGASGGAYQQQQQIPFPNISPLQGQLHSDPNMQQSQGQPYSGQNQPPSQGQPYSGQNQPPPQEPYFSQSMQAPQGQPYSGQNQPPPQGQPFIDPNLPPPQGQSYFAPSGQQSVGQSLAIFQRAFAGKGTPLMHTSWLLDGKQLSPADVRAAIVEKVQQRYANEVNVSQEHLAERDSVLEERNYVRIERAPANVFIYITPFASDLYISRTTTVQPTLSLIRVAVLGILFLLMLIGFIASAAGAGSAVISLFSALLLTFFVVLAIHSLVLGFTEKDFLVDLRPNVLNDFRIDDGAILEHIADRSIRAAVQELGLDASTLTPARNYPARQSLHVF